jgi:hypothetical protein
MGPPSIYHQRPTAFTSPPNTNIPILLQHFSHHDHAHRAKLMVANNEHSKSSMTTSYSSSDRRVSRPYGNIPSSHPSTVTMGTTTKTPTKSLGRPPTKSRSRDRYSNPLRYSSRSNRLSSTIPRYHSPASKTYSTSTLIPMSRMMVVKRSRSLLLRTDHSLPFPLHLLGLITPLHLYPLLEVIRTIIKLFTMSIYNTDLPMRKAAELLRSRNIILLLPPIPPMIVPLLPITLFDLLLFRTILCRMKRKMSILLSGSHLLGRNGTNILVIRLLVFELLDKLFLPKLTPTPTSHLSTSLNLEPATLMEKKRPRRCSICIRPRREVVNPIDHLLLNFLMLPCLRMLGLLSRKKRRGAGEEIDLDQ